MRIYSTRLQTDADLRDALMQFAIKHKIRAGFIITCVGSLKVTVVRMAGATPENQTNRTFTEKVEIVSLVGTLTDEDCHLHISFSNNVGQVMGGHLKNGTIIDTTAEIVIGEDTLNEFVRIPDLVTGFPELEIQTRKSRDG